MLIDGSACTEACSPSLPDLFRSGLGCGGLCGGWVRRPRRVMPLRRVTRACQRRLTTPERLVVAMSARKKIRWRAPLEAMVADVAQGAQSPLELEYLRRVERAHGSCMVNATAVGSTGG